MRRQYIGKKLRSAPIARWGGVALVAALVLGGGVPLAGHADPAGDIYQPSPTSAFKLTKDQLAHVYLTSNDLNGGNNNEAVATRYAKVIPLTDENSSYEQEWMAIFNMGLHDELYKQKIDSGKQPIDINDHDQVKTFLRDENIPFTSNPWMNILLSKDLKVVGDFVFYSLEPMDKQYENKYVSSFDKVVSRVQNYRAGDQIFRSAPKSMRPVDTNEQQITELTKSEALTRYSNLRLDDADGAWTAWSARFMESDGVGGTGATSFEFRNYGFSTDEGIQNLYNPGHENTWHNSNKSTAHFVMNDLGHGMRFQYETQSSSKEGRIVVKFKTKRTPMDFFKDEKWNFLRRDSSDQSNPRSTFVAAAYKSHDDSMVRSQMDIAVPKLALEDQDGDGLWDYYETLLGINPAAVDTDGDTRQDKEEYPLRSDAHLTVPAQGTSGYQFDQKTPHLHLIKNLFLNPNEGQYAWQPQIDAAKSLGASRIYGEDPGVGEPVFTVNPSDMEDGKLRYAIGSTITGKTVPYATVGLYPMENANKRELNVIAETVADKNGNFTLTLGYGLKRDKNNLNKWGNNILFANEDARTPQYDVWEKHNFDTIKANRDTAQIYVTSEGSDGRPAFLLPYYSTKAIQLTQPVEERPIKDRFNEALSNFKKVLVDNQKDVSGDIERIKEALQADPVISGMLNPDSQSYYPFDNGSDYVFNIPLKGTDIQVPVTALTEERRKLAGGSIDPVYDDDARFTMTFPTPQNGSSALTKADKYRVSVIDQQGQPKGEKTEFAITDEMLQAPKVEEAIGVEVAEGDRVVVEFVDALDRPLTTIDTTVLHRESSVELINPKQTWTNDGGFKAVFEIPEGVTDGESAFLTDADGEPILVDGKQVEGKIDPVKKTVTFDLSSVDDGKVVRASFTQTNKKPTISSASLTVDKRTLGNVTFAEDPAANATSVTVNAPSDIREGDRVIVSIVPAGSEPNTEPVERGSVEYTTGTTINVPLKDSGTVNAGDQVIVTVVAKNGHTVSTDPFTVAVPTDTTAVTEKPTIKKINADNPTITIGNVDPHADKITVNVGTDSVVLTKTDTGWGLTAEDQAKYDIAENEGSIILTPKPDHKANVEGKEITATATNTNDPGHKEMTSDPVTFDTTAPAAPEVSGAITEGDTTINVVKPNPNDDTTKITITIPTDPQTTIVLTKDENGTWSGSDGGNTVTVIEKQVEGTPVLEVTLPAGTEIPAPGETNPKKVTITAEDAAGNVSTTVEKEITGKPGETPKTDADKNDPNPPATRVPVANLNELTQPEKEAVKKAIEDANKTGDGTSTLPPGTVISVDNKGNVTVTYPDQSTDTIPSAQTVTEAIDPTRIKEGDTSVGVKEPTEADEIVITVPTDPETTVTVTKDEDGTWTTDTGVAVNEDPEGNLVIPLPEGTTIPAPTEGKDKVTITTKKDGTVDNATDVPIVKLTDAEKYDPVVPTDKVGVVDPNKLSDEEKEAVKKAIEDANKTGDGTSTLPRGTDITVDGQGNAIISYPDGTKDEISGDKLVVTKKPEPPSVDKTKLSGVIDEAEGLRDDDRYLNAGDDQKKAFDEALEEAMKVLNDPNATQEQIDAAAKKLRDAIDALNGSSKPSDDDNKKPSKPGQGDSTEPATGRKPVSHLAATGFASSGALTGAVLAAVAAAVVFVWRRRRLSEPDA